ncbi:MAG: hypothetical protein MUE85_01160 [Microscillaceae bacterium]|jgi:hypothetical protein|nr:hypothetical protein [Microscillaceae bacterium]
MKTKAPRRQQYYFTFITLLLLGLLFSYYFFVYIPMKEDRLRERGFRVLNRISENIIKRNRENNSSAKNIARKWLEDNHLAQQKRKADTLGFKLRSQTFNDEVEFIASPQFIKDSKEKRLSIDFDKVNQKIIYHDTLQLALDSLYQISYQVDVPKALHKILREDLFSDFILFNRFASGKAEIVYSNLILNDNQPDRDSLTKRILALPSNQVRSIEIAGVAYRVFTHSFPFIDNTGIIYGLIPTEKFNLLKSGGSSATILLISIGFVFLFLLTPLLKVILLSSLERISNADIVWVIVSLTLGGAILTLFILNAADYYVFDRRERENHLGNLSNQISENFTKELTDILTQLKQYEQNVQTTVNRETLNDYSLVNLLDETARYEQNGRPVSLNLYPKVYPYFKYINWADKNGQQQIKWTVEKNNGYAVSVRGRNYFQKIIQKEPWRIKWTAKDSADFSLEAIASYNTGEIDAVIAKPIQSPIFIPRNIKDKTKTPPQPTKIEVVALSSNLYSLMNPIMPFGFGFAVVDKTGKVWFHSDKDRSLRENLLEETDRDNQLFAALYAESIAHLDLDYRGKICSAYIRPLVNKKYGKVPLFLVTYLERSSYDGSSAIITTLCLVAYLIAYSLIILFLTVVWLADQTPSKLKIKTFTFDWLKPRHDKAQAYLANFVLNSVLGLTITTVLLALLITQAPYAYSMGLSITLPVLQLLFTYMYRGRTRFNVFVGIWFLRILLLLAGLFLIFLMIFWQVWYSWGLLLGLIIVFLLPAEWAVSRKQQKEAYITYYVSFLLSLILTTSLIPIYFIYQVNYQQETGLLAKQQKFELHQDLKQRAHYFQTTDYRDIKIAAKSNLLQAHNQLGIYLYDTSNSPRLALYDLPKNAAYYQFIAAVRPLFDETTRQNNDLLIIESLVPVYILNRFASLKFFIPIGLMLVLLPILFFLLRYIAIKIFSLDMFAGFDAPDELNEFNEHLGEVLQANQPIRLVLIGVPIVGKSEKIRQLIPTQPIFIPMAALDYEADKETLVQQIKQYEAQTATAHPYFILDHFDYQVEDPSVNLKKLFLLEYLLNEPAFDKVIITTTQHPEQMIENFKAMSPPDKSAESELIAQRWELVLCGFTKMYVRLKNLNHIHNPLTVKDLVNNECNFNGYLQDLKNRILPKTIVEAEQKLDAKGEIRENILLKIQSLAQNYYQSLWNSCSIEEKFILYDLAEDSLVNARNREIIRRLYSKGLIEYDGDLGTVRIFNESFQNFILSIVKPEDALQIEETIKVVGFWETVRLPFFLILSSIALFVFVNQQDVFNRLVALATAFSTGLPTLMRLVPNISFMKKSE